jgi:hypothetical protein
MLQLAHRTCAPSATSVSISTAVWIVMWSEPVMRAPVSGLAAPYSARQAMSPGISTSASSISLRPHSASERSATLKSVEVPDAAGTRDSILVMSGPPVADARGASSNGERWVPHVHGGRPGSPDDSPLGPDRAAMVARAAARVRL